MTKIHNKGELILNKQELVSKVAEKTEMTKKDVGQVVDSVLETIQETLGSGEEIKLTGFGIFSVKNRASRLGRNPRSGEEVQIPASKTPAFKAGKGLKDAVR